jgi:hypothetical protein
MVEQTTTGDLLGNIFGTFSIRRKSQKGLAIENIDVPIVW